ncbi:helix-turn-helix transcriptional regulator [Paraburkholderia sp. BCC1876]|uniref:helix-turn-helix domain-containing protein n=1 Tax=Paraburkholderia sp. BCC1876 TaxID=2676303 RepID=UPI001FC887E2|nr:helix-turn-helix transcriptional regulator [Paraburkholderia sp. BCC1876]
MNRTDFISDEDVQGFVAFLARVIRGDEPLKLSVGFSKNQLYDGFESKFDGYHDYRERGGPVYVVQAETLQDLFRMYWWNRKNFGDNMLALSVVSAKIKAAIDGENNANAQELAEEACHQVMKWGFGERRRAYTANMNWAKRQGESFPHVLRVGRESLSGDNPDIDAFGGDENRQSRLPRMNAGWTKYYALALPNHIIYDGRVGAALGFLVQRHLTTLARFAGVPEKLQFLWANGDGGGTLREPSAGGHQFGMLYGGRYGSKSWARVNVWANWVLSAARDRAGADWCAGPDGLRRLEAALFMLGYDFSRVRYTHSSGGTNGLPRRKRRASKSRLKAFASDVQQEKSPILAVTSRHGRSSPAATVLTRLPEVTAPDFRSALQEARLATGLTYRELARLVGVHAVMPSRYENATNSNATLPSKETWQKLNAVLFPTGVTSPLLDDPVRPEPQLERNATIDEVVPEQNQLAVGVEFQEPTPFQDFEEEESERN